MSTCIERVVDRSTVLEGVDLWNRQHATFRVSDDLVEQNLFAPFPGIEVRCYGGYRDGELVSFAAVKRLVDPTRGFGDADGAWLSLFAFDPDASGAASVAGELLSAVTGELSAAGHARVEFGRSPQNFVAGVPSSFPQSYRDVLRDAGFETRGTVHDLQRDITSFDDPAEVRDVAREFDGLRVERATGAEADLVSFLEDQFPGRWHYEAANICRLPGGAADYWVLRWGADVVGFARSNRHDGAYRGPNVNWGWHLSDDYCGVGPLGIHEAYRGRRWGLFMVSEVVQRLKRDGYDAAVVDWTDLPAYYEKLGFERWISYRGATLSL